MQLILIGRPITKKNSQRIALTPNGKRHVRPSARYEQYEQDCIAQITGRYRLNINEAVNVKVLYYMPTRGSVDLVNLLEGTNDILVRAGVLEDDNSKIVASHDGSRVLYDKNNPRAEITIERTE